MSDTIGRARFDVPVPDRIKHLPRDKRGYPVPWFVEWQDNEPVFPAFDARKWMIAVKQGKCWVCGGVMGRHLCFVVGPMCTINRISSEPPCHLECAEYSVKVCPFLTNPAMQRVPAKHYTPDGVVNPPGGIMEQRNPGITALWRTRRFSIMPTDSGPILQLGDPEGVDWWNFGRRATPAEAHAGFEDGAVFIKQRALERDGAEALPLLDKLVRKARATVLPMLPP